MKSAFVVVHALDEEGFELFVEDRGEVFEGVDGGRRRIATHHAPCEPSSRREYAASGSPLGAHLWLAITTLNEFRAWYAKRV